MRKLNDNIYIYIYLQNNEYDIYFLHILKIYVSVREIRNIYFVLRMTLPSHTYTLYIRV